MVQEYYLFLNNNIESYNFIIIYLKNIFEIYLINYCHIFCFIIFSD